MIPLLADEDFDGRMVRGLFRRFDQSIDLLRVQDVGLSGASDEKLLEWAVDHRRLLLTHDRRTMPRHVRDRLAEGQAVPGVIFVRTDAPIGRCIDNIALLLECSSEAEWLNRIVYLPFE